MKKSVQFLNYGLLLFLMIASTLTNAADVSVTTFGITGSGDESSKLQTAFDTIAGTGNTLTIPSGMTITVTKNMFLYGSCSIRGLGANNSSMIQCDADLNNDFGRQYWISVGISRHRNNGGVQNTFNGSIKDLTIKATGNAKFQRAIFFFNTSGATIDNVKFDFLDGVSDSQTPEFLFGATASGYNASWTPNGAVSIENITIIRSSILANHCYTDSEGFSISLANNVEISDNYIHGVGDDPIGCHIINGLTIKNNFCYSIDGRIYTSHCTDVSIENNYCEMIQERGTTWRASMAMIYVGLESNQNLYAPTNISIKNNFLRLPANVPGFNYCIRIMGGRNVTVEGNIIQKDTPSGGGISVEADTTCSSWTDRANPQLDTDHIARPRDITIKNNILAGAYPGKIYQSGLASYFPGAYYIFNNISGGYSWYTTTGNYLYNSNIIDDGNYSASGAVLSAIADPVSIFSGVLSNVKPSQTVSGNIYTAIMAGRVSGYNVSFTPATSGGFISLQLWKNGVNIKTTTISGSSGTYALIYNDANLAFVAGDTLQLKAVGSSTLLPNTGIAVNVTVKGLETTQSACYKFETLNNNIITDSSGCGNDGTVSGATQSVDALNGNYSMNFDGNDAITVDDHASLNIYDNLSVSFWIKPTAITDGYAGFPLRKSTSTTDANFVCYYFGNTAGTLQGKIGFYANRGGTWGTISSLYSLPANAGWTHVAMVYNSTGGGQLYINGSPYGAKVGGGALATNNAPLTIGTGNTSGLNAKLDDVRIFSRALTDEEILSIYNYKH